MEVSKDHKHTHTHSYRLKGFAVIIVFLELIPLNTRHLVFCSEKGMKPHIPPCPLKRIKHKTAETAVHPANQRL